MSKTVRAIFDGASILRLQQPLDLPPDTPVYISVNTDSEFGQWGSALRYAEYAALIQLQSRAELAISEPDKQE